MNTPNITKDMFRSSRKPTSSRCWKASKPNCSKFFNTITEEKSLFAYAEGKWTIKEVLSHLIDGERIFAYRTLRISRGDETPIEGFEQDGYIENQQF